MDTFFYKKAERCYVHRYNAYLSKELILRRKSCSRECSARKFCQSFQNPFADQITRCDGGSYAGCSSILRRMRCAGRSLPSRRT